MTQLILKMTENDHDRKSPLLPFFVLHCTFSAYFLLFAIKFRQKTNRTYCITATYSFSSIES